MNPFFGRALGIFVLATLIFTTNTSSIQNTPKDYLKVPKNSRPMDGLLPSRGIGYESDGILKINSKYLKNYHRINFDTREVEVIHYVKIDGAADSNVVYETYYRELGSYSMDLSNLAMYKFWLEQYIGQQEVKSSEGSGNFLEWELPVKVPEWLKRWGADKPKLNINGSYKVIVSGKSVRDSRGTRDNWIPTFNMENKPSFSVTGSVGRLIHIEIFNEEGFGTNFRDQLKIAYRGEGDELEDNIIQEIEAGNTSLSLTGTQLTGYTDNHKGIFGLKVRMKFGDLHVTTIASQEGGSQERQTLGVTEEETVYNLDETNLSLYKHFFLELKDRAEYADSTGVSGVGSQSYFNGKSGVVPEVYILEENTNTDDNTAKEAVAYTFDINGNRTEPEERGRWRQLKPEEDFHYNSKLRMLSLFSPRQNSSYAVRWDGGGGDPLTRTGVPFADKTKLVLIKSRRVDVNNDLEPLMWRHVYSIGKVSPEDRSKFKLKVKKKSNNAETIGGKSYATLLGLTKPDKPTELNIDNPLIFDFEQGNLVLPCNVLDSTGLGVDNKNCLTPFKRVNPNTQIYTRSPDEIRELNSEYHFEIFGKQRKSTFDVTKTSHSVSGSGCLDITPGTERLYLNGSTELKKDEDYEVLYEVGQITLLSQRAKDPTAKIDVSYECTPFFQIQDKILLGTRLEYKLDGISDESLLGATFLYKSQSTTQERPQLGREPFQQFLWGFNSRLAGSPSWMTDIVNLVPFVETQAPSKWNWEMEMAQSFYNPNPKGTALLDDFESSKKEFQFPLTINNWFKASPPGGNSDTDPNYDPLLNYQRNGEFIWHSNLTEQFQNVFLPTSSSRTNTRELRLFKFILRPNDNLQGTSWGGVMRAMSPGLRNQSRQRILEVVIRGRQGKFNVDLGNVSEDIAIAGYKPNGILNAEVLPGEFTNSKDYGLDGIPSNAGETGQKWECKPDCYTVLSSEKDPAEDDHVDPEEGESDPLPGINGTENNNDDYSGRLYDTEDLNSNGVLDTKENFVRYSIDLEETCDASTNCEPLRNDWRKYQIPIYEPSYHEIFTNSANDIEKLLSNVEMTRMWLGDLPPGVSQAEILLARVSLIGNAWEEAPRNTNWENAQIFNDGSTQYEIEPEVSDSNYLRVKVINNREEKESYEPSPNTKIEEDPETDEPLREQSLVLNYENLHPGEVVHATRIFGNDNKDLTLYSNLLMEVHPRYSADPQQNKVSFSLQLGRDDGNEESSNYYEIKIHADSTATSDHKSLWERHALDVRMGDLSALKNSSSWRSTRQNFVHSYNRARGDSSLVIGVVGDPSLSNINWMRLVIEVDSTAEVIQQGEFWVNDLRLRGVNRSSGISMRSSFQTEFADFINLSGNITATNGNFTSMTQNTKNTPANSKTTMDFNTNASLYANKFFPDAWGISLPLSIQYRGSVSRPFTKPYSDELLENHDISDLWDDFLSGELSSLNDSLDKQNAKSRYYQSRTLTEVMTAAYRKEKRSKNFFVQSAFERPALEFTYTNAKSGAPSQDDTTTSYKTRLTYDLSPYKPIQLKPWKFKKRSEYVPDFIQDFQFSPYPNRLNLVVADYSFVNSYQVKKDIQEIEPDVIEHDWEVDMTHGLDLSWRLFNFYNLNYRLSLIREFDNVHEEFSGPVFWDMNSRTGLFAWELLASSDSAAARGLDVYGVMANEKSRNNTFQMDFNPEILSFVSTSAKLSSQYKHTRSEEVSLTPTRLGVQGSFEPEHFQSESNHDISLNTGLRLNRLLQKLEKLSKPIPWLASSLKSANNGFNKIKLQNINASYTISHRYTGEEFTFEEMNRRGIDPFDFYAYQLGLIYDPSIIWNYPKFRDQVIMGHTNSDYRFFDYLSSPMVQNNQMKHIVTRTTDLRSGFTVPIIDLNLSGSMKWTKSYTFNRDYALARDNDTSFVFPDYTVTGRFSNFAPKIPFLKKHFRNFSANHSYNFKKEWRYNKWSEKANSINISHNFSPLVKLSATMKNNVRMENSVNWKFGHGVDSTKTLDSTQSPLLTWDGYKDLNTYSRKPDGGHTKKENWLWEDIFSLSYDIQTQKGIQFWRWYVKLENNLRFKLTAKVGAEKNTNYVKLAGNDNTKREVDLYEFNFSLRPEVSYNFTRKIDMLVYVQYMREQEFHTENEDTRQEIEVHSEFTMRF